MSFVRVTHRPLPKLYVLNHRLHHGMTGLVCAVLGAVLMWHDRHDLPWLSDQDSYRFIGPRRGRLGDSSARGRQTRA